MLDLRGVYAGNWRRSVGGGSLRIRLAVCGIALFATTCLSAQELRDRNRDIDESRAIASDLGRASIHKGPLYLLSSFDFSDIGYGQSFFVPTADQSSGFSFSLRAPHKLYFVPHRKVIFSADVTPSYNVLSRKTGQNQVGYFLRTDARLLLNHVYVDGYITRTSDLRPNVGDINRLVTLRENNYGITSTLKYSSRTSLHGSAEFQKTAYPKDKLQPEGLPVENLAFDANNYRVSGHHKTFPLTSLMVAAEHSTYNFAVAKSSNATRTYLGAGFAFDDGRTQLSGEAGPARLDFRDPTKHDFRGWLVKTGASRRFSTSWSASISGGRDLIFSISPNNPYFRRDSIGGQITWNTTRKLTLHLLGNYGRDNYDTPIDGILRHDTLEYIAIGWLYGIRHISGGFDVGYFKRTSNSTTADQDSGIRGTLRLSIRP